MEWEFFKLLSVGTRAHRNDFLISFPRPQNLYFSFCLKCIECAVTSSLQSYAKEIFMIIFQANSNPYIPYILSNWEQNVISLAQSHNSHMGYLYACNQIVKFCCFESELNWSRILYFNWLISYESLEILWEIWIT